MINVVKDSFHFNVRNSSEELETDLLSHQGCNKIVFSDVNHMRFLTQEHLKALENSSIETVEVRISTNDGDLSDSILFTSLPPQVKCIIVSPALFLPEKTLLSIPKTVRSFVINFDDLLEDDEDIPKAVMLLPAETLVRNGQQRECEASFPCAYFPCTYEELQRFHEGRQGLLNDLLYVSLPYLNKKKCGGYAAFNKAYRITQRLDHLMKHYRKLMINTQEAHEVEQYCIFSCRYSVKYLEKASCLASDNSRSLPWIVDANMSSGCLHGFRENCSIAEQWLQCLEISKNVFEKIEFMEKLMKEQTNKDEAVTLKENVKNEILKLQSKTDLPDLLERQGFFNPENNKTAGIEQTEILTGGQSVVFPTLFRSR